MALEERIDNVGKKQKVVRRKKKGDDDVDVSVNAESAHMGGFGSFLY